MESRTLSVDKRHYDCETETRVHGVHDELVYKNNACHLALHMVGVTQNLLEINYLKDLLNLRDANSEGLKFKIF